MKIFNSLLFVFFFLTFPSVRGETEEVIMLSRKVGMTIDAEENEILGLFPDIYGFESAQFFKINENKYYAKITYVDHTQDKTMKRYYSWKQLQKKKYLVSSHPEITEEVRADHRYKLSYLRVHELLEQVPPSTFCTIRHANGRKITGTFVSYQDRVINFQSSTKKIQIPISEIAAISYRPYIDRKDPLKKTISFTMGAILGLSLGELWNLQSGSNVDMTWHNRFSGTVMGLVSGTELFKAVSILSSPKKTIAFTPEEIAKLKYN